MAQRLIWGVKKRALWGNILLSFCIMNLILDNFSLLYGRLNWVCGCRRVPSDWRYTQGNLVTLANVMEQPSHSKLSLFSRPCGANYFLSTVNAEVFALASDKLIATVQGRLFTAFLSKQTLNLVIVDTENWLVSNIRGMVFSQLYIYFWM